MDNQSLVVTGQVVYVENSGSLDFGTEVGGGRIKVRLDSDKQTSTDKLPWAFPLLPRTFQAIPKEGEGVFVLTASASNPNSQRYYIGPIISQPQFFDNCPYDSNRGEATSLLSSSKPLSKKPLKSITKDKELTKGSFPDSEDVAILGRGQEDIILKYRNYGGGYRSEINLRSGIRVQPGNNSSDFIKGNVVYNASDPAYIQIKHDSSGISGKNIGVGDYIPNKFESRSARKASSMVNIVADKVNIISHKDVHQFGQSITDRDELVKTDEIDSIMSKLHRTVYGDELITLLKKIVQALKEHTHPCSMVHPTIEKTILEEIKEEDFENILSPNVRIS